MAPRRMRWAEHAARMEERRGIYRLREIDHLEDPGVNRRILLRWIFRKWNGGMDWIDLAQDRDTWRAPVNAVIDLRVP